MTLTEFLTARLDEDETRARVMADTSWPSEVWVTPDSAGVAASVSVSEHGPKAYTRVWISGEVEHGWVTHDSAVCVWSAAVAARVLREVDAKRKILAEHSLRTWGVDDGEPGEHRRRVMQPAGSTTMNAASALPTRATMPTCGSQTDGRAPRFALWRPCTPTTPITTLNGRLPESARRGV